MTPTQRTKARAFAIWRYANPRDWNVTYEEIAEATGMTVNQVHWVFAQMGWWGRIKDGQVGGILLAQRSFKARGTEGNNRYEEHADLTQIFRTTRLTSAQEFGIDWG